MCDNIWQTCIYINYHFFYPMPFHYKCSVLPNNYYQICQHFFIGFNIKCNINFLSIQHLTKLRIFLTNTYKMKFIFYTCITNRTNSFFCLFLSESMSYNVQQHTRKFGIIQVCDQKSGVLIYCGQYMTLISSVFFQ